MKAALPACAALACAACAPSAGGQPVLAKDFIADFASVCVAADANRAAVVAKAEERGWPRTEPPNYPGGAPGADRSVRLRGQGQAMHAVISEQKPSNLGAKVVQRSCTMMATVDDPTAVIAYAKGMMAKVTSGSSSATGGSWQYVRFADGPRSIESQAHAIEAAQDGRLRSLMVSGPDPNDPQGATALSFSAFSQN